MNKKIWLKLLSLALASLFCITALMSCKQVGNDGAEDTESDADGSNSDIESETEVDVLEGVTYEGEKVSVLSWIPSNLKEYVPEFVAGAHVVEQKTYERMVKTKNQLKVEVEWKEEPGNGKAMNAFITVVANDVLSGNVYDVICCYSTVASSLTASGYSTNLLQYETLDFTQEWYPQNLVKDCTMFNRLYFCTGDISTNLINMTSVVFFNHDLMDEYKINEQIQATYGETDIYELVRKGKWTQEAMLTLSKIVYENNDNTGDIATEGDTVGLSTYYTLLCNFYYGAGYKTINVGDEGVSVSEDYLDADKVGELIETWGPLLNASKNGFLCEGDVMARDMFSDGRSLFSLAPASHAYVKHAESDVEFGALPVPKGSNDQTEYYSVHSRPYSMFLIPSSVDAKRGERSASFIHCLGQWSYETTRTAIINTTMKGRYATASAADAEMWDYIIDSQVFDMGRVFETMFNQTLANGTERANTDLFPVKVAGNQNDWASMIGKYTDALNNQCADINNMMQSFDH